MSLAYSPWLEDWRRFLDEAEMSPAIRRQATEALQRQEKHWAKVHKEAYQVQFARNRATRNEKVVAGGEEMKARLRQIRSDLASGRITAEAAQGEIRDIIGWHKRAMALHDTLANQDAELEAFAAMTPDQYQRDFIQVNFPALRGHQPSLASLMAEIGKVEQGGKFQPIDNPPAPADETPDWHRR